MNDPPIERRIAETIQDLGRRWRAANHGTLPEGVDGRLHQFHALCQELLSLAPASPAPRPSITPLEPLRQNARARPPWLVEGLLREGCFGWIGAGPKTGKSYLATDLLLAIGAGRAWLDHFPVPRPRTCLLIEEEDHAWLLAERLDELLGEAPVPDTVHALIQAGTRLDEPDTLEPIHAWCADHRPGLIVWDVFSELHSKNENAGADMRPLLREARAFIDRYGTAVLINHHNRKPAPGFAPTASGGERMRGWSGLWGAAEQSLYLARVPKTETALIVEPEGKSGDRLEPFKIHLEAWGDGRRRLVYDGPASAQDTARARRRADICLALADGALTRDALAGLLHVTPRTIGTDLRGLVDDGALRVHHPGSRRKGDERTWILTPLGEKTAGTAGNGGNEVPF
jgi:hypothetical protein